jgi:hypothetical protein
MLTYTHAPIRSVATHCNNKIRKHPSRSWSLSAILVLVVLAISCNSKGCAGCNHNSQTNPSDNGPAGLSGSYEFDTVGTQPFQITVIFSGNWSQGTGSTGQTSFSVTQTAQIQPGGPGRVTFSVSNLKRGTWVVNARPTAVAGPITCQHIVVPGIALMSVAGGNGPLCNPN